MSAARLISAQGRNPSVSRKSNMAAAFAMKREKPESGKAVSSKHKSFPLGPEKLSGKAKLHSRETRIKSDPFKLG